MENMGRQIGSRDKSIPSRKQETEERITGIEYMIKEVDSLVKENVKFKIFLTQNIHKIWNTMKK